MMQGLEDTREGRAKGIWLASKKRDASSLDTRMGEFKDTCTGGDGGVNLTVIILIASIFLNQTSSWNPVLWRLRLSLSFSVLFSQSHQQSHMNGSFLTVEQGPIHCPE